ncbi:MAG: DUF1573 domain-containing protein [Bacteroidales bacterium]|nr:DUF1573 domain-containing protein [Bacteroidales bacterium]
MKKIGFCVLLLMIFAIFGCQERQENGEITSDVVVIPATASGKTITDKIPIITFEKTEHDFGKVIRGEKVTYRFKFKNTGKAPLLISNVASSCGCTVPEYSKLPIQPNGEGEITVTFNSQSMSGFKRKGVTVMANTQPSMTSLWLTATVFNPSED